jgi:1,4-dihydroxy-2-naphthoate octaprenyltransferase
MSDHRVPVDVLATRRTQSTRSQLVGFAQLGKVRLAELWVGPLIALSLLIGTDNVDARGVTLVGLFFLVITFGMCATHAFDDVNGYRDGTDAVNYAPERQRSQVKPLVVGTLRESQALWFGYSAAAVALISLALFAIVSGFQPRWLIAVGVVVVVAGMQYSFGFKFSYRIVGGGELVLAVGLASSIALPYAAATGLLTGTIFVESALFGIWLLQVAICSNSGDAEVDREAGRRTIAAITGDAGNRAFVAGVFASSWLLAVGAMAVGYLRFWTVLFLLPTWALQARVLIAGLREGRWRFPRNYSFLAVRCGSVALVVVNLLLSGRPS